jgi:hypothetical protein
MADPQLSARAAQQLGLPEGMKTYGPYPFGGMNAQDAPHAIEDNEFTWLENFVKLGKGQLRTLWDHGTPFYTVPVGKTIIYHVFYSIGVDLYCMAFLSDGKAVQIDMATLAQTAVDPGVTTPFYDPLSGYLPFGKQWGSTYLLICNRNQVNDYWAWDGSLLYGAGTAAPRGVNLLSGGFNYSTTPTVAAYGGSGSGMTFTTTVDTGRVTLIEITNPGTGYLPGDVVQLQFTGGGSDDSAVLQAALSAGEVGGVAVTAQGAGYTTAAINFSGGGGAGAAGTVTLSAGKVTGVTITSPGTGYTSAPSAAITGDGAGATVQPVLAPAGVSSITVVDGGSGFTSVPLITLQGGGGSGATAIAVLTPTSAARVEITAGGSGYTSAPAVSFTGGGGAGDLSAYATLTGSSVSSITITNAGTGYTSAVEVVFTGGGGSGAGARVIYVPTSIASVQVEAVGQFYTDAPEVLVTPGANNSAYATVSLMPFGISGSAMETFLSRVWIVDPADSPTSTIPAGNLYSFSAASSIIDFSTSGGGGDGQNTDSFLQRKYVNVRQSNGYLYFFGDGSVSVVSNITTSGTPSVTTYNYQNADPQSGLAFRDSLFEFGRSLIFANDTGVYGLYGGSVTNISVKVQQLFNDADFTVTGVTPSGAIAVIFNVKHYLFLVTLTDPDDVKRNVMVAWNEKDWMIFSQSFDLVAISTQKDGSDYFAYGTNGSVIFKLFASPSTDLTKKFDTKVYGSDRPFMQRQTLATYMTAQDRSTTSAGVYGNFTLSVSGIGVIPGAHVPSLPSSDFDTFATQPSFQAPAPYWPLWGTSMGGVFFVLAALRFNTTAPDFILGQLQMAYKDVQAYFGQ